MTAEELIKANAEMVKDLTYKNKEKREKNFVHLLFGCGKCDPTNNEQTLNQ